MQEPTYYVQFASPHEVEPEDGSEPVWHTIARVHDRRLADEIARLAESGYMRTTVTSHYSARAVSRSALRREGHLHHADWELGMGKFRAYADGLRERAERNLRFAGPPETREEPRMGGGSTQ